MGLNVEEDVAPAFVLGLQPPGCFSNNDLDHLDRVSLERAPQQRTQHVARRRTDIPVLSPPGEATLQRRSPYWSLRRRHYLREEVTPLVSAALILVQPGQDPADIRLAMVRR